MLALINRIGVDSMTSKRNDQIRELLKGIETGNEEAVAVTNRTAFRKI